MVTLWGVICGAETWLEIENYGIAKQEGLETFLELPQGIPSDDPFERMLARLHPEQSQPPAKPEA
ncbi:MAG: transposase family protein [Leptolyngbyaceae cyanobacterium CSU_1_4]|nr:transposase family protein [Leptolyngbyaceae cyanobacterium CSU_1_4]